MKNFSFLSALVFIFTLGLRAVAVLGARTAAPKQYHCEQESGKCQLSKQSPSQSSGAVDREAMSQATCLMLCDGGSLWPYPTGSTTTIDESFVVIDTARMELDLPATSPLSPQVDRIARAAWAELVRLVALSRPRSRADTPPSASGRAAADALGSVRVALSIDDTQLHTMRLGVDESYSLEISATAGSDVRAAGPFVTVRVNAPTVFGARHALSTLSQLVAFDDLHGAHTMAASVTILDDRPQFAYRGVMVDSSRSFIRMDTLRNTVRALSYNKMNVLHLHLSDTASFPVALASQPNVTYYGAYSEDEVYTPQELSELVDMANTFGVLLLPEVDGPAHVASGFEWGAAAGVGDLVLCDDPNGVKGAEWMQSGLGPPTGQLNLANDAIYGVLGDIYGELLASAGLSRSGLFHIGGDEIIVGSDSTSISCYNSSAKAAPIVDMLAAGGWDRSDQEAFYSLWQNYTAKVSDLVAEAYGGGESLQKLHIWGGAGDDSSGTKYNLMTRADVTTVLPPDRYTVQVWDEAEGSIVPDLVGKGYDVVLSHTDYVYLDCGNAGWAHPGGYWCQPYHEWQKMYGYITDVLRIWGMEGKSDKEMDHILGSETLAWSEMIDSVNFEAKVWPRTAALAEALWGRSGSSRWAPSDAAVRKTSSWYAADPRMQRWREVLVARGVGAEALQTRWCQQRGAYACTVDSGVPQ